MNTQNTETKTKAPQTNHNKTTTATSKNKQQQQKQSTRATSKNRQEVRFGAGSIQTQGGQDGYGGGLCLVPVFLCWRCWYYRRVFRVPESAPHLAPKRGLY